MRRRSALAALVAATGAVVLLRRRRDGGRERVDLYSDDGSVLSLADDARAAPLLALAREALRSARA